MAGEYVEVVGRANGKDLEQMAAKSAAEVVDGETGEIPDEPLDSVGGYLGPSDLINPTAADRLIPSGVPVIV